MKELAITDHNMMDIVEHGTEEFPIQYYVDELFLYPQQMLPMHWHNDIEFYQAIGGTVKIKIYNQTIHLHDGEVIFINKNVLHSFQQLELNAYCRCPNIVFSSSFIADWNSTIYTNYVQPILLDTSIPYIIFNQSCPWHKEVIMYLDQVFSLLQKYGKIPQYYGAYPLLPFVHQNITSSCFELDIHALIIKIWKIIFIHFIEIPTIPQHSSQQSSQIRLQKMITFIEKNFYNKITLNDIADQANISKSEASRCFQRYLKTSPILYLNNYRLKKAKFFLLHTNESISSVAFNCGFQSLSYFNKRFTNVYQCSPSKYRKNAKKSK